ncbi:MAG: dethiobiotin synthase [Gammaproteobacteria bacterium]|nr:dethiobiotin synthase [Gammaproteobacteria bacterium]MCF6231286.1 dethiobiotin synthase [Gammaproteobacteria bacterium]
MNSGYFVTGTDTEIGKTYVSCALLRAFSSHGKQVAAMKPVASGCHNSEQGLRNDDALQLIEDSDHSLPYETINPYAFAPAIAPHIAAQQANTSIDFLHLKQCFNTIAERADITIVEGAGGWLVPLDNRQSIADLAAMLALPVILVVGIKLGCINHALLTAAAIREKGVTLAGWVANRIDPECACVEENIQSITQRINTPCLGDLPYAPHMKAEERSHYLHLHTLL